MVFGAEPFGVAADSVTGGPPQVNGSTLASSSGTRTGARVSNRTPLLWLALAAMGRAVEAQTSVATSSLRHPVVAVLAGPSPYDLSGVGTGFAAAIRLDFQLFQLIIVEPGLGWFRYRTQDGSLETHLLPELSLQAQARLGPLRPYLGGGAGLAFISPGDWSYTTLHGAAGVRLTLAPRWLLRAEFRLRTEGPGAGNMGDIGLGAAYRL